MDSMWPPNVSPRPREEQESPEESAVHHVGRLPQRMPGELLEVGLYRRTRRGRLPHDSLMLLQADGTRSAHVAVRMSPLEAVV